MSEYEKDRRWLDEATNQTRLFYVLIAICVGLFGADFAIERHAHFAAESVSGFYAVFGFVAYSAIVGAGWLWRRVVLRRQDYYDG